MNFLELFGDNSYRLRGNSAVMRENVCGVTADPAKACAGFLLVCTRTPLRNGHAHVAAAYSAGCRAFLVDQWVELPDDAVILEVEDAERLLGELAARFWDHPARELTVIGLTGTAGKTSVAHTLTALLSGAGYRVGSVTTDGVRLGPELRPAGNIVPDAAELQRILREFRDAGITHAVLEFSAYMLVHKAAFSIPFAVLLLTNLWEAHIGPGEFKDHQSYTEAKLSLLRCGAPVTVLPTSMGDLPVTGKCLTFGEAGDTCVCGKEPYADGEGLGTRFDLVLLNGEKVAVSLPVPGDFAIENALAAATVAAALGLAPQRIAACLSMFRPRGRMECVSYARQRYVFVDSAYEGESLTRALNVLRPHTRGRLTVVIGSVGNRAQRRRAPLGGAATTHADLAYFTADDPNFEDPLSIFDDMMVDADTARCCFIPDRRAAIERAILEMRPGDVLLIAGKGGSEYQLINGQRLPFDEKEIVTKAMARL